MNTRFATAEEIESITGTVPDLCVREAVVYVAPDKCINAIIELPMIAPSGHLVGVSRVLRADSTTAVCSVIFDADSGGWRMNEVDVEIRFSPDTGWTRRISDVTVPTV